MPTHVDPMGNGTTDLSISQTGYANHRLMPVNNLMPIPW